ncbi:MAG: hypothetical protein JNK47_07430 [Mesorhizobium sp.]|nr:hypothetical protein [Mesorhizobium sp.]MBL8577040.1 hypothetical protein [Mesorhizobium sp.]
MTDHINRSLYLAFLNRELSFIRGRRFTEDEYIRFVKICSLMNSAELYASFAQTHEVAQNSKHFVQFISELSRLDQLRLINGEPDFKIFLEKRKQWYGSDREKYGNYFAKMQPLEQAYRRSQKLHTSEFIKSELISGLSPYSKSNIITSDERGALTRNASFINEELPDPRLAATFSIYERVKLAESTDARIMGDVSTRLFCNHYAKEHDLISPTGVYDDYMIEDFEYFPHYDVEVNFSFLSRLKMDQIISDKFYERDYFTFITHKDFWCFADMKKLFFDTMSGVVGVNGRHVSHCEPCKRFIRGFNFTFPANKFTQEPARMAEIIASSLGKAAKEDDKLAAAIGKQGEDKLRRNRIVLFTATDIEDKILEVELLANGFKTGGMDFFDNVPFNIYTYYDSIHIFHARTSAGSGGVHGSLLSSTKLLAIPDIKYAISVGICFGADSSRQKFGDVLVSEIILPYELSAARAGDFESRGIPIVSDNMAIAYARGVRSTFSARFGIHVGPVLSGEKLVDDPDFKASLLRRFPKAIGGEMECSGLAASCLDRRIPFVMFKGICDFAENKEDKYQELAATNASTLAANMISARWNRK